MSRRNHASGRALRRISLLSLLCVALWAPLLGGCTSVKKVYANTFLAGDTITYDQYLALDLHAEPAVTVDDVIDRLGTPADVFDRNGVRKRLDYHAFSLDDRLKRAEFHFDKNERLTNKSMW